MQEIIYKIFNIAEAALIFLGNITGLGYEMDLGAMFARIEGTYSNYEEVELKSTGSDVSSTIRGDIDALTGRISLGMAF